MEKVCNCVLQRKKQDHSTCVERMVKVVWCVVKDRFIMKVGRKVALAVKDNVQVGLFY